MQFADVMFFKEMWDENESDIRHDMSLVINFRKTSEAYMVLSYTTLFSVKLSFLLFFRILVRRVRIMIIYWWTVLAIMFVTWLVSIVAAVVRSCPIFGTPDCTR